jgi:hypothetical protein
MKYLKQVKCSERLPTKDKWYFVNLSTSAPILGIGTNLKWISEDKHWYGIKINERYSVDEVEYWYEEIKINDLDTEQILPKNERNIPSEFICKSSGEYIDLIQSLIIRYKLALETAELKLTLLTEITNISDI